MTARAVTWRPPPRPAWVTRLNQHATAVGGAANLVALDGDALVETARASTGRDDFGPDTWRAHYDVLLRAIHDECDLHVVGRLMTRTEVLRSLRARLSLAAAWADDPAVLERPINEPVFVTGFARSGTSILHELLALDPTARAPRTWELDDPAAAASTDEATRDAARRAGDATHSFWADAQPEYDAMHHNAGDLPNECIFATAHEFLSDHWSGCHGAPSYTRHLVMSDHTDAYRCHRRILQTLQGDVAAAPRWLLKAPSHLATLRTLFAVYPDARVVHVHRDPLKCVPSTLSLMGTLRSMRSDTVDLTDVAVGVSAGFALMLDGIIADRARGRLPDDRFVDVRYADLMTDPGMTVARIEERLGRPAGDELVARVRSYVAAKPRGAFGVHRYAIEDFGLDATDLRERFAAYCARFGVASES
jgi:hypothetical protein